MRWEDKMRGVALVYALVIMFVSVMLIAAAVILSTSELKIAGTVKVLTRKFDAAESGLEQFAHILLTPQDVAPTRVYNVGTGPHTEQVTVTRVPVVQSHPPGYAVSHAGEFNPLKYEQFLMTSTVQPSPTQIRSVVETNMSYGPIPTVTAH